MKVLETIPPNDDFKMRHPSPLYPQKVGRQALHFSPQLGCWFTLKIKESLPCFAIQMKFYETDHDPFTMNKPCRFKTKKRFQPVNVFLIKESVPCGFDRMVPEELFDFANVLREGVQLEQYAAILIRMDDCYTNVPVVCTEEQSSSQLWKNESSVHVMLEVGLALAAEAGITKNMTANEYFLHKMMSSHLSRSFKKINLDECRCSSCY